MTLFMLLLAEMIPAAADSLSKLGVFFNVLIFEMFLMIVLMCYVARMYNKSASGDEPIPDWMRRYIFDDLSYRLWVRKRKKKDRIETYMVGATVKRNENAFNKESEIQAKEVEKNNEKPRVQVSNCNAYETTDINGNKMEINEMETKSSSNHCESETTFEPPIFNTKETHQNEISFKTISTSLALLLKRKNDLLVAQHDKEQQNKRFYREWTVCAMTLDRISLISFVFIVLVTCFIIF